MPLLWDDNKKQKKSGFIHHHKQKEKKREVFFYPLVRMFGGRCVADLNSPFFLAVAFLRFLFWCFLFFLLQAVLTVGETAPINNSSME